jgi:cell division protein FtsQ
VPDIKLSGIEVLEIDVLSDGIPMGTGASAVAVEDTVISYQPPTREALRQRRQHLRQQRRSSFLQAVWRLGVSVGVLSGLGVMIQHPHWQLIAPEQIVVTGNQWLSDDQIRQNLGIHFPVELWHIQPQSLEEALLATTLIPNHNGTVVVGQSPVRSVLIHRQLIPAGLRIHVEERIPVARSTVHGIPGFVDQEGTWLSLQHYPELMSLLPGLTLEGWEHHSPDSWATLLRGLKSSAVRIDRVLWPAGEALRLETEIGPVVLGSLGDTLAEQIYVLGQMRELEQYCNCGPDEIEFIDLTSARSPSIQFFEAAAKSRFGN